MGWSGSLATSTSPSSKFDLIYMFFVSKDNSYRFYLITAASVKCRMAAVKSLPVLHHSAVFIFYLLYFP